MIRVPNQTSLSDGLNLVDKPMRVFRLALRSGRLASMEVRIQSAAEGSLPNPQPDQQPSRVRNRLWIALKTVITISALCYFGFRMNWSELRSQITGINATYLGIAWCLLGAAIVVSAVRWWYLLKVQMIEMSLPVALAVTFIGQFFNAFMLGALGGDVFRTVHVLRYTGKRTHATLSILLDRLLGFFVMLLASLLSLAWQYLLLMSHEETREVVYLLVGMFVLFIVTALVLALLPFERTPAGLRKIWQKIPYRHLLELAVVGFRAHFHSWFFTSLAILFAIVQTFLVVLSGYWMARGLHLNVSYIQMLQALTVALIVMALPISIGGHGVREGIFVFMFAALGIISRAPGASPGTESAILFSLIFFFLSSLWSAAGGLIYIVFRPSATP